MRYLYVRLLVLLGIGLVGFAVGATSWILYYQNHIAPEALRNLQDKEAARVIAIMVQKQPYKLVFDQIQRAYPVEEPWMHLWIGHALGENMFRKYQYDAFQYCENFFNDGCYHGVISYIVRSHGVNDELFDTIRRDCERGGLDIGECVHPVGHAFGWVYKTRIHDALALCNKQFPYPDLVPECWMGALMEYTADFSQAQWRKKFDTLCGEFEDQYQWVCTRLVMRHLTRDWEYDFDRLFARCSQYETKEKQSGCANELGYWVGAQYFSTVAKGISVCNAYSAFSDTCLTGLARTYITTHKKNESLDVCTHIYDVDMQHDCMKFIEKL